MFAHVPITALCRTTSILNRPKIPNVPSRSQQVPGREGGDVTITQMQTNRGRVHEMRSKKCTSHTRHGGFAVSAWSAQQREARIGPWWDAHLEQQQQPAAEPQPAFEGL